MRIVLTGVTTPEQAKRQMDAALRPARELRERWDRVVDPFYGASCVCGGACNCPPPEDEGS